MGAVEMTSGEVALLTYLRDGRAAASSKRDRPAKGLVAKGYARWIESPRYVSAYLQVTDEGQKALVDYYATKRARTPQS